MPSFLARCTRRETLLRLLSTLTLPALSAVPAVPAVPALAGLTAREAQAAARPLPALAPATLDYEVFLDNYRKGSRVATMQQQFELQEGRYRLHAVSRAKGLLALVWRGELAQTSEGLVDAEGLKPLRYEERRGDRAPRGAVIDRSAGQVRFLKGEQAEAPANIQDRLSALVQLGLLVAAGGPDGAPLPAGHVFDFPLLRTSRVAPAQWRIEDREELALPSGKLAAIRVKQLVAPDDDSAAIEAWFDPARAPWAVRVRIAEPDGQALDQVLERG